MESYRPYIYHVPGVQKWLSPIEEEKFIHEDSHARDYAEFYEINFSEKMQGIQHLMGYFDAAGFRVMTHVYRNALNRGTVFLLHGYFDHVGLYKHVIHFALQEGFNVVGFDLPGHGLSSGERVAIDDFEQYQNVFKRCLHQFSDMPKPWHVIAQSTGGAIVIDYLLTQRLTRATSPFTHVILLAPLVRPRSWGVVKLLHSALSPFTDYIDRKFTINSQDIEFIRFLKNVDPLQSKRLSSKWVGALKPWVERIESLESSDITPVIFQGDEDQTVDFRHNLEVLKQKFNEPDIVMIEGARHHLSNESETSREKMFRYLKKHLSDS